jgi:hypothetical protein
VQIRGGISPAYGSLFSSVNAYPELTLNKYRKSSVKFPLPVEAPLVTP